MKNLLLILAIAAGILAVSINNPAFAAETKKVCVTEPDPKTKKPREVCKTVTVHKKLEGTKVPEKTAK